MDALSSTYAALADPTRRAILARLAHGSATVGELAEPFEMSAPAISRHLKVLERARLIRREVEAQKRRCHLRPEALGQAVDWIESQRRFWSESLDGLSDYLSDQSRPVHSRPVHSRPVHSRSVQSGPAPSKPRSKE